MPYGHPGLAGYLSDSSVWNADQKVQQQALQNAQQQNLMEQQKFEENRLQMNEQMNAIKQRDKLIKQGLLPSWMAAAPPDQWGTAVQQKQAQAGNVQMLREQAASETDPARKRWLTVAADSLEANPYQDVGALLKNLGLSRPPMDPAVQAWRKAQAESATSTAAKNNAVTQLLNNPAKLKAFLSMGGSPGMLMGGGGGETPTMPPPPPDADGGEESPVPGWK